MKVTPKHARRLQILRHTYELMKDFSIALGAKESAFAQTDAELDVLQKRTDKALSGVIAPSTKPFDIENVDQHEFIVPKKYTK